MCMHKLTIQMYMTCMTYDFAYAWTNNNTQYLCSFILKYMQAQREYNLQHKSRISCVGIISHSTPYSSTRLVPLLVMMRTKKVGSEAGYRRYSSLASMPC